MESIGLTGTQMSDTLNKPQGLLKALELLKSHLGDLQSAKTKNVLSDIFPGGRGRVITVLLNQTDLLAKKYKQIASTTGQFGSDVAKTQQETQTKIKVAWSKIEADAVQLGQALGPDFLKIGEGIANDADKIATAFSKLPAGTQQAIITGGLITAGIGPALKVASVFSKSLGELAKIEQGAQKLATGKTSLFGSGRTSAAVAAAESQKVAVMEVGELVAKNMAGVGGVSAGSRWNLAGTSTGAKEAATTTESTVLDTTEKAGLGATLAGGLSRTLGAVGVAAMAAPFGFALEHVVSDWIKTHADDDGKRWASKFLATMPKEIQQQFAGPLARAREKQLELAQADVRSEIKNAVAHGAPPPIRGPVPKADLKPTAAEEQANAQTYFDQGRRAGNSVVKGLVGARLTSTPIMMTDFVKKLRSLPAQARPEAAKLMLSYAEELEKDKKLPDDALAVMIDGLVKQFPGLNLAFRTAGLRSSKDFADAVDFSDAQKAMKTAVEDYGKEINVLPRKTDLATENLNRTMGRAMHQLKATITAPDTLPAARKMAVNELQKLQKATDSTFDAMQTKVSTRAGEMAKSIQSGSVKAREDATTNFAQLQTAVYNAMQGGSLSTTRGMQIITKALNATLKALGDKKDLIQVTTIDPTLPRSVRSKSVGGAATGALYQVGSAGERGRDTVPLSIGSANVVVGRGEQVAVLNHEQQALLNSRLSDLGGLSGMFQKVNRPHYMATGGIVPGFASGGTVSYSQLEGLWDKAGGKPSMAPLMAAIAEAESSGNPRNTNPSGASGLWQIMMPSNAGYVPGGEANVFNPLDNAIAAVRILGAQGLGAWATYTSGAYRQFLHGGVPPSAVGGAVAAALKQLKAPVVNGAGPVAGATRAALAKAVTGANAYLRGHAPASSAGSGGPTSTAGLPTGGGFSPSQLGSFDGKQVADWIIPELEWARAHGWGGTVTSGWRSPTEVVHGVFATAPQGQSEHQYDIYPGGAVDVSDYQQFAQIIRGYPGKDKLIQLGIDPLHFSGTGHARGGLLKALAGGALLGLGAHANTNASSRLTSKQRQFIKAQKGKHHDHRSARRKLPRPVNGGPRAAGVGAGMGAAGGVLGADGPFPFAVNDLLPISALLGSVMGLDGDNLGFGTSTSGVTNLNGQMSNLMDWWNAGLGAGGFPALGTPNFNSWESPGDFVIDTDANGNPITPYVSDNINTVVRMLSRITGLEQATVTDLLQAKNISNKLTNPRGPVQAAIKRRQKAIRKIKARIAENVKRIKEAKRQRDAFLKDKASQAKRQKTASDKIATLTGQLKDERKKKHPDASKIKSLSKQISDQEAAFKGARSAVTNDTLSAIYLNRSVIAPLESENKVLGGSPDKVGKGGELGQLATQLGVSATVDPFSIVSGNTSDASGLLGVLAQAKSWTAQLNTPGGFISAAQLQLAQYQTGLSGLLPGASAAAAQDAQQQQQNNQSQLLQTQNGLLQQQLQNETLTSEVSQAQYGALSQAITQLGELPPFGGSFATGGTVPGPIGAARTVIAHGGETITPPAAAPVASSDVHVHIDRKSDLNQLIDVRIEKSSRTSARLGGRPLPSGGGGVLRPAGR